MHGGSAEPRVQIADRLEANFMLRLPPSGRINKFRPTLPSTTMTRKSDPTSPQADASASTLAFAVPDLEKGGSGQLAQEPAGVEVVKDVVGAMDANAVVNTEKLHETTAIPAPSPAVTSTEPATKKSKKAELNPEHVKLYGKRKAKKIAAGKLVMEDGEGYDRSLLKAMFSTVWFEWCFSVVLNICAGGSRLMSFCSRTRRLTAGSAALQVTAPLVTKKIITQLSLAYYYHQAQNSGISLAVAGIPAPKSVGYGIGLAFALFAMEMSSSLFTYQAQQRASVVGFMLRASVGVKRITIHSDTNIPQLIDMISRKSMYGLSNSCHGLS